MGGGCFLEGDVLSAYSMCMYMYVGCLCIYSSQSENFRNLEIALRILRIPRLCTIGALSRDCAIHLHDLEIAQL